MYSTYEREERAYIALIFEFALEALFYKIPYFFLWEKTEDLESVKDLLKNWTTEHNVVKVLFTFVNKNNQYFQYFDYIFRYEYL